MPRAPKTPAEQLQVIQVRLPIDAMDVLRRIAQDEQRSLSQVVRIILERNLMGRVKKMPR
jgi:hypothetical protein